MDQITSLFMAFNAYTHSNPVLAGVVSLWGLTAVSVIFRKIPAKITAWIYGQMTTTLEFDNTEVGWTSENYAGFMTWYMSRKQVNFTRHFSVISTGAQVEAELEKGKAAVVGVGNGTHYFFYKKRLCRMNRRMLEKQGSDKTLFVIVITFFSRNRKLVQELVDEFCYKIDLDKQRLYRFGSSGQYWSSDGAIRKRSLRTVMAAPELKNSLVKDIEDFLANRQWYYDRGLDWKKTFIIKGKPGGGKTSLIKALAGHFGFHIARLNLSALSDSMLESALSNVPKNSIVLIEDFDSADAVKTRHALKLKRKKQEGEDDKDEQSDSKKLTLFSDDGGLTLSGVLNALDGVVELDGVLIFMTTNVLEDVDPAVYRKGRVDKIYDVPALTHAEVIEYIELMYPHLIVGSFPNVRFHDIMGCDLQAAYFEHPDSVYAFIDSIPKDTSPVAIAA